MRNPLARPAGALLALLLPATIHAVETITWDQAADHVGRQVTVEGHIVGVHCSPLSCLLAFEPTFDRFTAVVQAERFDVLPPEELESRWVGQRVQVSGRVQMLEGKPEIVLDDPAALVLAPAAAPDAGAETAERQAESLDRLADALAEVTALTERLLAMQERMEVAIARLEASQAAVAEHANAPPPPPPPSHGDPQPRPRWESLRTVKQGMAARDVERLVGQPSRVERSGNGWTTWYYGYDRSISFDARGRARSLVGFPDP